MSEACGTLHILHNTRLPWHHVVVSWCGSERWTLAEQVHVVAAVRQCSACAGLQHCCTQVCAACRLPVVAAALGREQQQRMELHSVHHGWCLSQLAGGYQSTGHAAQRLSHVPSLIPILALAKCTVTHFGDRYPCVLPPLTSSPSVEWVSGSIEQSRWCHAEDCAPGQQHRAGVEYCIC